MVGEYGEVAPLGKQRTRDLLQLSVCGCRATRQGPFARKRFQAFPPDRTAETAGLARENLQANQWAV